MTNIFTLDPQLQKDCFILSEGSNSQLLLLNNSLVPWFILVPKTDKTEWYQLDVHLQVIIQQQLNELSGYIKREYQVDKLNVANIGNIVSQLHIHVVGRFKNDYCWPGVVWGSDGKKTYTADEVEAISQRVNEVLKLEKGE